MAKETKRSSDIWLPAEFFYGDFIVEGQKDLRPLSGDSTVDSEPPIGVGGEDPDDFGDDYMAVLAGRMASSFLLDDGDDLKSSPAFPAEKERGRILLEAPLRRRTDVAFRPPARQNLRSIGEHDAGYSFDYLHDLHSRRKLYESSPAPPEPAFKSAGSPVLTHRQIQAAHFHRLRQQQLMKQHQVLCDQRKSKSGQHNGRPLGLSPAAWPPLAKPAVALQDCRMRAVFLRNEKESAGTGVFLPRTAGGAKDCKPKKTGCSTVLVPARVVQALNLDLDVFGDLPRISDGYVFDHNALVGRNGGVQRSNSSYGPPYRHGPSAIAGREVRVAKEWAF